MAFDSVPWILDSTTVDAEVIRRALGTLIGSSGGVVTPGDLAVTQNGTPNMSVNVGPGQIWVPGKSTASTGPYYARNGASDNVSIAAANATNPRVDTIVVQVEDPAYGGSGAPMAPKALAGTPTAGVTQPPTTAAQAASDGAAAIPATSSAYVLAYVLVPASATTITNADISNVALPVGGAQAALLSGSSSLPLLARPVTGTVGPVSTGWSTQSFGFSAFPNSCVHAFAVVGAVTNGSNLAAWNMGSFSNGSIAMNVDLGSSDSVKIFGMAYGY